MAVFFTSPTFELSILRAHRKCEIKLPMGAISSFGDSTTESSGRIFPEVCV
jgi:hypothetical protein